MAELKGSKTHQNLKDAFAGESQANRRYLYFAKTADVEGYPEVAGNFRDTAEGETGHAHGHLDYLKKCGDPATDLPIGDTESNLKAAVAGAPVVAWEDYDTHYTERYMGLPQENEEGYRVSNVMTYAAEMDRPLLLIHGTADDNVHPQNSWHFVDELVEANVPFDLMMYPMRKHGISDSAARIHLFNKMVEFWRLYL